MTTPTITTDEDGADEAPDEAPGQRATATARYAAIRNGLIGVGAFYVSRWMAGVLRVTLTALAHEVMSVDGLRQALLTPFITSLSHALAAASAGAVVVLLVEAPGTSGTSRTSGTSESTGTSGTSGTSARWRWAAVPAVLWFLRSLDEVTISAPGWVHLATQLVAASLPSIVCLAAGHLADWHRSR